MTRGDEGAALRHLGTLFGAGAMGGLTDAQLLERFTSRRDEAAELAFAVLVERHGPMVLRTCRALLRDSHEAHDAFQATFLILARKAGSLWVRDSLGPWLHQVALRTASHALRVTARRRKHERLAAESAARVAEKSDVEDLGAVLSEEVDRLPQRYRAVVVLCLLEGLTPEQAALQLDCPVGTVHSRLARGRQRLRDRLRRRGLAPPEERERPATSSEPSRSAVPIPLLTSTVGAATRYAAGEVLVSAPVVSLMEGVLRMMLLARMKLAAALLLAVGIVAIGVRVQAGRGTTGGPQAGGTAGRSRTEDRPRSQEPPGPPERAGEKEGGVTREDLIAGLLARSTAITSGRFEYHLRVEIAGRVLHDSDYRFTLSGEDWAELDLRTKHARVNHDGRLFTYAETPQRDGRIHRSVEIGFPESPFKQLPYPPVRAGTFWNSSTGRFVRERTSRARLSGAEDISGIRCLILEWDVDHKDKYLAFESITDLLQQGGRLRLHVARQLGHALPRIEHIDRFGTVQDRFDYSEFQEVAPRIHVPKVCRLGVGGYTQEYRLKRMERINEPFSGGDLVLAIPAGTSVQDVRPKSKDTVDRKGNRTFSLKDYPFRQFQTGAPYPHGFPRDLLRELDRDVVGPTGH